MKDLDKHHRYTYQAISLAFDSFYNWKEEALEIDHCIVTIWDIERVLHILEEEESRFVEDWIKGYKVNELAERFFISESNVYYRKKTISKKIARKLNFG